MRLSPTPSAALLGLLLVGCAGAHPPAPPLGRSFSAHAAARAPAPAPAPAPQRAPAPVGDPPAERGGTIAARGVALERAPGAGAPARSPQAALRRYALAYVNWRASGLAAHERALAALGIDQARLAAQQAAVSPALAGLAGDGVSDSGQVVAIAPGQGAQRGRWVVVTWERTSGSGPYAGLPAGAHVTFASLARVRGGWVVSAWDPAS